MAVCRWVSRLWGNSPPKGKYRAATPFHKSLNDQNPKHLEEINMDQRENRASASFEVRAIDVEVAGYAAVFNQETVIGGSRRSHSNCYQGKRRLTRAKPQFVGLAVTLEQGLRLSLGIQSIYAPHPCGLRWYRTDDMLCPIPSMSDRNTDLPTSGQFQHCMPTL